MNEDEQTQLFDLCCFKLSSEKLTLLYRATRDGFGARAFHSMCDNFAKTLTIIKTKNGDILGGYTNQTWSPKFQKSQIEINSNITNVILEEIDTDEQVIIMQFNFHYYNTCILILQKILTLLIINHFRGLILRCNML